jgi:hypothetical protein
LFEHSQKLDTMTPAGYASCHTALMVHPILDLDRIILALFKDAIRTKISFDYGIVAADSPKAFTQQFVDSLDQKPSADPFNDAPVPRAVFRAAVRAIGSNSRRWATFVQAQPRLEAALGCYDPAWVSEQTRAGHLSEEHIKSFFPGQTSGADARATLAWADYLCRHDLSSILREVATFVRAHYQVAEGEAMNDADLMPVLALFFSRPPSLRWNGWSSLPLASSALGSASLKFPGMGPTLASELFRNLGWSGFKPDRHVTRLFDHWIPSVVAECQERAVRLAAYIGRRDSEAVGFLKYSLAGIAVTPEATRYSVADNLVWALGAYVETKRGGMGTAYVLYPARTP